MYAITYLYPGHVLGRLKLAFCSAMEPISNGAGTSSPTSLRALFLELFFLLHPS